MPEPAYDLQIVDLTIARPLIERFHGYGSVGNVATLVYAVVVDGAPVAAYVWNPPAPGAAKAVSPGAPHGALALTRMVAIPRDQRTFHVSRPLRRQVRTLIDRGRWPVLVTYSDASMGHTGHVYRCSGWQPKGVVRAKAYVDGGGLSSVVLLGRYVERVALDGDRRRRVDPLDAPRLPARIRGRAHGARGVHARGDPL